MQGREVLNAEAWKKQRRYTSSGLRKFAFATAPSLVSLLVITVFLLLFTCSTIIPPSFPTQESRTSLVILFHCILASQWPFLAILVDIHCFRLFFNCFESILASFWHKLYSFLSNFIVEHFQNSVASRL